MFKTLVDLKINILHSALVIENKTFFNEITTAELQRQIYMFQSCHSPRSLAMNYLIFFSYANFSKQTNKRYIHDSC